MDFTKYIDQGILVAQEFIKAHGQTAWETVLWLVIMNRLSVLFFIVPLVLAFFLLKHLADKCWVLHNKNEYADWEVTASILTAFKWCTLIPISLIIFNLWNWIGVFYPELYLAKQAMDRVLN